MTFNNIYFMKTKEELESLKEEMAHLKSKLVELTDEELAMVTGGQLILHPAVYNFTKVVEMDRLNLTDVLR